MPWVRLLGAGKSGEKVSTRVYLDWNATAPLRPEARAAMIAALEVVGNPSSVHAEGRAAKMLVERAREDLAATVGCRPGEVVFTSGATEAAGVLSGFADVTVEPTAHDCLMAHAKGAGGVLALGLANSETGILSEMPARGGVLVDVVQAVGRVPFAFGWSGADFAILSAHKLGGPKGVGALIVREGIEIAPLRPGGGQETGRRSGTENIVGIAGFAAAATAALRDLEDGVWEPVRGMRDRMEAVLSAEGAEVAGAGLARLPNTSCLMCTGWKGETQVMQMDLSGFAVSAGSACSSGKVRRSRVLTAMGYDDLAAGSAIRVSLGPATEEEDVVRFAEVWAEAHRKFRARAA